MWWSWKWKNYKGLVGKHSICTYGCSTFSNGNFWTIRKWNWNKNSCVEELENTIEKNGKVTWNKK